MINPPATARPVFHWMARPDRSGAGLTSIPHCHCSMAIRPPIGNSAARLRPRFPDFSRELRAKLRRLSRELQFRIDFVWDSAARRPRVCVGRITQLVSYLPEGPSLESIRRNFCIVMPGLVPGIQVFAALPEVRRGWPGHGRSGRTPFFERLCPAMTEGASPSALLRWRSPCRNPRSAARRQSVCR
jgi:hypothetical protein